MGDVGSKRKRKRIMENTLFVALSRQMVLRRNMEVIANNVANASTPGFKGEQMMFVEHLAEAGGTGGAKKLSFVQDIGVARNYAPGELSHTGNPLDLAIKGKGWFVVQTPQGEQYTRNGRFQLDKDGQLVSSHGHPVLGKGGRKIVLGLNDRQIEVKGDGTIKSESGQWQLEVVSFENQQSLRKVTGSLYRTDADPKEATDAKVSQGVLEESNVEPIIEVTRMISALRDYQSAQRMIQTEHERQRRAIQTITKDN